MNTDAHRWRLFGTGSFRTGTIRRVGDRRPVVPLRTGWYRLVPLKFFLRAKWRENRPGFVVVWICKSTTCWGSFRTGTMPEKSEKIGLCRIFPLPEMLTESFRYGVSP